MVGILIALAVAGISLQDFLKKKYNCTESGERISIYCFNLMLVISAMIFFVPMTGGSFEINGELIFFAALFAVTYFCATFFSIRAIKEGSMSLTSLFMSYALIIPTLYGVVFRNEDFGAVKISGMALLLISLYFVSNVKKGEKISGKWFLYVILMFLGNGLCSTFQRVYQIRSGGDGKAEFMIIALGIIAIAMVILVAVTEKKVSLPKIKNGGIFAVFCGLANGGVNLLTMILAKYPASIVYPTISAGGIILTFILAKFVFREKMSVNQYIGFCIGVVSVVLLNI